MKPAKNNPPSSAWKNWVCSN